MAMICFYKQTRLFICYWLEFKIAHRSSFQTTHNRTSVQANLCIFLAFRFCLPLQYRHNTPSQSVCRKYNPCAFLCLRHYCNQYALVGDVHNSNSIDAILDHPASISIHRSIQPLFLFVGIASTTQTPHIRRRTNFGGYFCCSNTRRTTA